MFSAESMLPPSPSFEQQSQLCAKCKFYNGGSFLSPVAATTIQNAELLVIVEGPDKRDIRSGCYLGAEPGDFFFSSLEELGVCANRANTVIIPAVRCMPPQSYKAAKTTKRRGTNATSKEAELCWKASGMFNLIQAYCDPSFQRATGSQKKRILLLGYWPTKLVTGKLLIELHEQVLNIGDAIVGVLHTPNSIYAKNVRWRKDEDGRWYTDPPNGEELGRAEWKAHSRFVLERLFAEGEGHVTVNTSSEIKFPHVLVHEEEEFIRRIQEREGKLCHLDVETYATEEQKQLGRTALDWFYGPDCCMPLCMGLALFDSLKDTNYDPFVHAPNYDPNFVPIYTGEWTDTLAQALAKTKLYAFNGTYDTGVLYQHTGVLADMHADPCDMAYVVNQKRKKYSLESLALEYVPNYAGWGSGIKGAKDFSIIERERLYNYNAGDNVISAIIYFKLVEEILASGMQFAYWRVLAPAKNILRDMEARGVRVDLDYWEQVKRDVTQEREDALNDIRSLEAVRNYVTAKQTAEFNPRSDTQVKELLEMHLGVAVPSANKEALKGFAKQGDEFSAALLKYRNADKKYGIYVKTFGNLMDKDAFGNCVIYASYKTNTTETGRTSSGGSDVVGLGKTNQINLQNVPRSGGMRKLFIPRPGMKLAYGDYSQIEVRVAGAYSRSYEIVAACHGDDFHGTVASKVFKVPFEEIMAEAEYCDEHGGTSRRTKSKSITFGLIYGMQADGLALKLGCTKEEAQQFIDEYFLGMPSVKAFIDRTHAFVAQNMYVQTHFGRIRRFDRYNSATERESVNTLVQATASDIFLMANQAVKAEFMTDGSFRRFFFPWGEVHDAALNEFYFDAMPKDEVKERMEYAMTQRVRQMFPEVDEFMWEIPLATDVKILDAMH